jgi:hypothetical protein
MLMLLLLLLMLLLLASFVMCGDSFEFSLHAVTFHPLMSHPLFSSGCCLRFCLNVFLSRLLVVL